MTIRVYVTYFVAIEDFDDMHKIDLWRRLKEDWPIFHKKYIEIWQCIMVSHICCQIQKGVSNVTVGGQDKGLSILGQEKMPIGDQHLL
ncbi:hypothetical protein J1N35_044178 [Gossypium stocksii]|uniref:Uncharacterized protein n=1 Tax=Gossypium stocksii TaxID=47602 RepID=A0A9D3U8R8_9ROSI|nr:hypothetical protein J1N35_044178 [Gossypium stocksii]